MACSPPVCVGAGLVVLDAIYGAGAKTPAFSAGGSCANVLTVLSYLGWDSYPVARIGGDPEGRRLLEDMASWGARTDFIDREPGLATPRIIERITGKSDATHRFSLKCGHGRWLPQRRAYLLKSAGPAMRKLPEPRVFYFDRADPAALEMAREFRSRGAVVFFEPPRFLQTQTFTKCLEAADIVKHCGGRPGRAPPGIPLEILTLGKEGLEYRMGSDGRGVWERMKAFPARNLVDAAGSGDWLSAGLIHRMFGGGRRTLGRARLDSALRFGQALASINCGFPGARGAMYAISRGDLLDAASRLAEGRPGSAAMKRAAPPRSKTESRCRVCLCGRA